MNRVLQTFHRTCNEYLINTADALLNFAETDLMETNFYVRLCLRIYRPKESKCKFHLISLAA